MSVRDSLSSLCAALGLGGRTQDAAGLLEGMAAPWTRLSFTIGAGDPEVRLLAEAPTAEGRAMIRRIAERYGLALDALDRVADLFDGNGAALRLGATLQGSAAPRFEVFFQAQARERWMARASVEEALVRLGFSHAWPSLAEQALRRGYWIDELRHFSIDLGSGPPQWVKAHVQHLDATADDMRAALGGSPLASRAEEACLALTGSSGTYGAALLGSTHVFADPGAREPSSRALQVPVAVYGANDAVTRGRVSAYLAQRGLSSDAYERALASYAHRPLAAKAGLQSYVTLREDAGGPSLSVDLSPDAPDVAPAPVKQPYPPPAGIYHRFENEITLAKHPFLQRVAREPVDLAKIWLLIANFSVGIVEDFPKNLATVIAKIDDDRVRCVFTKQLNDELGEGDFSKAHKAMFRTLRDAFEPHRLAGSDEVLLAPGRAFNKALWGNIHGQSQMTTVGEMCMVEIGGQQLDSFLGGQFRRQSTVPKGPARWLFLHEELEVDHAGDSLKLAEYIPDDPEAIKEAWQGAEAVVNAGRNYFDALYRICFG